MHSKSFLRKKFYNIRKRKYFEIESTFFNPLLKLIKKGKKKKLKIALYHPINYEVNVLKILEKIKNIETMILLPVLIGKVMKFSLWKRNQPLVINKFGVLEPALVNNKCYLPDIILVPLLAFDNNNYRLGYGKGYYDKYICMNKKKKFVTVGIAFSFQKYNKIPIKNFDAKLDYVLSEKGLKK